MKNTSSRVGISSRLYHALSYDELPEALVQMKLDLPRPVIVLVGGAGGLALWHQRACRQAVEALARLAQKHEAAVVSGGTDSGVIAMIGEARRKLRADFPLIGVVVERLIHWPGNKEVDSQAPLQRDHSHFLLVPGSDWGEESLWIARLATVLAGDKPSFTALVNGGEIARKDVQNSLGENRKVLIARGTGRLADELANQTKVSHDASQWVKAMDFRLEVLESVIDWT